MAINKKLIHFNNFSTFNSKKLSANKENTKYTLGINGIVKDVTAEDPLDILYQSICYIKDTKQQWTHGQLYDCSTEFTEDNIADMGFTKNVGTITEIKMNGVSKGTSGVVDLGNVVQLKDINEFITLEDVAGVATSGSYNDLNDVPWQYVGDLLYSDRSVEVDGSLSAYEALYTPALYTSALHDKDDNCGSKGQVLTVDDNGKIIWEDNITESTVSDWGFTKKVGTITEVSVNGKSLATHGVADIPAASTGIYGVTKLNSSTSSTSTTEAATPSAVKAAYDLANSYKGTVTSVTINGSTHSPSNGVVDLGSVITKHQILKTINGQSIIGSGDIVIEGGNVQAVDTGDVIDDVNVNYATTAYVDGLVGDINSVLESIINS